LAMTGSGKSYTVGRIIERLVAVNNGTVVVFDPHGEYGKALAGGNLQFSSLLDATDDKRDQEALPLIKHTFEKLQAAGAGIKVFSPQHESFK
ncbi:helicase HerA domain-containing protein, partial [Enterococcus faecalis]